MYNNMQDKFAPVREGEEIDVRIEAVGEKGDGIAKRKGFVLFIPNVKEGDLVKVKVTKVLQKVGFAEVLQKIDKINNTEQQPQRAAPVDDGKKEINGIPIEEEVISEEAMANDCEDFGEESDSEDDNTQELEMDEEAPAEEVVEEAPAEEVVEEAPAEEVVEEAPAEEEVEEAPAEEEVEETAEEVVEEAPAEEEVEETPVEETAEDGLDPDSEEVEEELAEEVDEADEEEKKE